MVVLELCGLTVSSTKVLVKAISNSIKQAVALNAPNGNLFQKIAGAVLGKESTTHMLASEAKMVLNIEEKAVPTLEEVMKQYNTMVTINDLTKGGSPYLNQRFLVAAHVLARIPKQ